MLFLYQICINFSQNCSNCSSGCTFCKEIISCWKCDKYSLKIYIWMWHMKKIVVLNGAMSCHSQTTKAAAWQSILTISHNTCSHCLQNLFPAAFFIPSNSETAKLIPGCPWMVQCFDQWLFSCCKMATEAGLSYKPHTMIDSKPCPP